ncbi:MAG: hypothetical protein K0S45_139 [Nitrospira sp.]|nr:hypothetical protein [Nitrospira sp.]
MNLRRFLYELPTKLLRTSVSVISICLLLLSACSEQPAPTENRSQETADAAAGFANIVWTVSQSSSVAPETLYVFLSDGTLVITAPHGKPALGRWRDEGGILTMIEEGIPYQVDILDLSRDQFKIRSHNPGKPAEITLVPAERRPR